MGYPKSKDESYRADGGINSKASSYNTDVNEFLDIKNMNFRIPGALSKRPGTTLYSGATVTGRIGGLFEFQRLSGASYLVATANTTAYTATNAGFAPFRSGLLNNGIFDFVPFVDRLFAANGQDFFKFDGSAAVKYGLPPVSFYATAAIGVGATGVFSVSAGYINDVGYYGPTGQTYTIALDGITFGGIRYTSLTIPSDYGITGIQFYKTSRDGADLFGTTAVPSSSFITGGSFVDFGLSLTTRVEPTNFFFTLAPKYLELYNNELFMSGFSGALSTLVWSDIGQPESVQPDFNAEVRTNDGDMLTGMKSYSQSLIVTKKKSFHRLSGDDPYDFLLQELSDQYGCLSNRAMVIFNDLLWFLDEKGIVEYNGANVEIVSNKVQPTFDAMNSAAAVDNAIAIHYRDANEVWFAIPINGSETNNCIVVYDYIVKNFTTYEGINCSSLSLIKQNRTRPVPFIGGYTGNIYYTDLALMGDNGQAITCTINPRFHAPGGQSSEQQFRRFYLDVNPVTGITQPININFRSNYSSQIVAMRTMYQATFQSRVDFGIPARSLSPQIIHASASLPFEVNGYTIESRFQRGV